MANNAPFPGMQPPRPPMSLGPAQGGPPSMSIQFRPAVPLPVAQQSQPYASVPSHQFQQVAHTNIGLPSHNQQFQFSQPVQQLPARPSMVGPGFLPPQSVPTPEVQSNRSSISVSPQPLQNAQVPNSYAVGLGGPQMPLSAPYTFGPPSGGQLQRNDNSSTHYQPLSQMNISSFPVGGQPWLLAGSQAVTSVVPVQQIGEQSSATTAAVRATTLESTPAKKRASFWLEHTSCAGKKYYYNRKTKFSTWEKPIELMTPIERADASTNWKEYESPDGRKYYYNRVTKQSKWIIPDELKLAREQVKNMASSRGPQAGEDNSPAPAPVALSVIKEKHFSGVTSSLLADAAVSSPIEVASVSDVAQGVTASEHSALPVVPSVVTRSTIDVETHVETVTEVTIVSDSAETSHTSVTTVLEQMSDMNSKTPQDIVDAVDGISPGVTEETEKGKGSAGQVTVPAMVDKTVVQEVLVYENKLEAKKAFKALLESANVGSDWTWDQAMRAIINDPRYGALRTLGERKQAFNEFLVQRKKQDAEERRARLRKAQEDFRTMLEESKELTSSTRWSKAIAMFEDDERFKAVERAKDREDLFEDYMEELEKKERAKALEEKKRNRIEYLNLLKSCDFITASSQWRKVQDRLEDDERCSRLEKIDRLEIFQEYIRDLEKEEEEQRKLQLDELRKAERKNRDDFRKLMEGHVAEGILTAETHWREYCMKVKDLPAYLAVSSNTSGSTAKDLFEDVAEELQKQYLEDKDWIKDTMKLKKIALSSNWTLEDFKAAIIEDIRSPPLSDTNLKLIFSELHERAKEKEEKEAKRRKRLADDFNVILCTSKDITASCRWEDWKQIHEYKQESWFIEEESFFREIFENYVTELKEKVKEKERMRRADKAKREKEVNDREKEKHFQEKGRGSERKNGKDRMRSEKSDDETESYFLEGNKRSGKDKEKKHRKRHGSSLDYSSSDETEKDRSRRSHRHSSERKKSKQMERRSTSKPDSSQNKHKRHKKDRRSGSHRKSDYEDRDFGEEDVDVW